MGTRNGALRPEPPSAQERVREWSVEQSNRRIDE